MGWIYGNTIVDTNNSVEIPSYQYDKIFSNYYLAQKTLSTDNVFLGRKVLVDYNQPLEDTLDRVILQDGKYYYWKEDGNYTTMDEVTEASITIGTIVYTKSNNNNQITFLECTSNLDPSGVNKPASLEKTNICDSLQEYWNDDKQTTYEKNLSIDKKLISNCDKSYDSTVWQKVYINSDIKYIMIAELNALNPVFDLLIKPPEPNGLSTIPLINIDKEDAYKLVLSTQPGLRISDKPYARVEPYRPNIYYYDNEEGKRVPDTSPQFTKNRVYYRENDLKLIYDNYTSKKFYILDEGLYKLDDTEEGSTSTSTQYYLECSDEKTTHSEYKENNSLIVKQVDGAIYYNKKGLEKDTRSKVNIDDTIYCRLDGVSGYTYSSGYYYEYAKDITDTSKYNTAIKNNQLYYIIENLSGYSLIEQELICLFDLTAEEFIDYQNTPEKNLYYSSGDELIQITDESEFDSTISYYTYSEPYNENRKYFYKKELPSGLFADTNLLSIYLPSIGNMVCEGWDKIYGEDRKLGEYKYNPITNKLTNPEEALNEDKNSIVGILNLLKKETQRIRLFTNDSAISNIDTIAKSLNLEEVISEIEETDEEGNTNTVQVSTFTQLTNNDIILNQIAINNLGIKSIADLIGLDVSEAIGYEPISNVTVDSYLPGLYYYKSEPDVFKLDETGDFTKDRQYYVCRINTTKVNSENGTIQELINANHTLSNANKTDLGYRRTDIHNLADLIGLNKEKEGTATASATLSIMSAGAAGEDIYVLASEYEKGITYYEKTINNNEDVYKEVKINSDSFIKDTYYKKLKAYDNNIQGQIYRNDNDITSLIGLLGFTRNGYDQLSTSNSEQTITNNENNKPLLTQITYNDYDIEKLANRIRRIEEFLKGGCFIFTSERNSNLIKYDNSNDDGIPGETNYNLETTPKKFS